MTISRPFLIEPENVGYDGFEPDDVGKWCVMVSGCTQIFKSKQEAIECYEYVNNGGDK